jgi:hypothetical protein
MNFRPRYSLRTLLVLVAIVGVGLGLLERERRIVNERRRLYDEISANPQRVSFTFFDVEPVKVTWLQKWLGDYGYGCIVLSYDASEDEIRRVKRLFSPVYQMGPPSDPPTWHEVK